MPIYEYQCQECGRRTETLQRLHEPPLTVCEECGGPLRKLISAPAFQFKGSGWYVTDYARKGGGDGAKEGAKEGGKEGAKEGGKAGGNEAGEGGGKQAASGGAGGGEGDAGGGKQAGTKAAEAAGGSHD